MIYAFYGDRNIAKQKGRALAEVFLEKNSGMLIEIDADSLGASEELQSLADSQGLFEKTCVVLCDDFFGEEGHAQALLQELVRFAKSDNVFIFREGLLNAEYKKALTKHAEKIEECGEKRPSHSSYAGEGFNPFLLADALGKRDRKGLWILYNKALRGGSVPEELHGLLFWQIKSIALARSAKSAAEAGMKDFPYQKAKGFAKLYKEGELEKISASLVSLVHDARRGGEELPIAMERFILNL